VLPFLLWRRRCFDVHSWRHPPALRRLLYAGIINAGGF
jgi:hypothetical protein